VPTRILYLITELDVGGAEKALCELVHRLNREAYAPVVACLSGRGPVAEWLAALDVPVHTLGLPDRGAGPWDVLTALRRLRRLVRRLQPAILHTILFHANLLGRLGVCRRGSAGRPVIVSAVRVAERRFRWHLLGDYVTHGLADCEVCVSEGVRRFMRRQARIPPDKLRVIPNGVDLAAIDAVQPADLADLGCRTGGTALCYVGRLDGQKGLSVLLRALARLRGATAGWHLVVVGEGPLRGELAALARRLHIDGRVQFLGWRPDALTIVAACDLFVMPSLWEGMPNAVMEAMALGRCVVATAVEGTTELIESGRSGLLVPPRQVRRLADAITVAITNPDRRAALGRSARERIADHFTIERTVARYEALYRDLLHGRGRPAP